MTYQLIGKSVFRLEDLEVRFPGYLNFRYRSFAHRASHRVINNLYGLRNRKLHVGDDRVARWNRHALEKPHRRHR